jgi:hypothetical protein
MKNPPQSVRKQFPAFLLLCHSSVTRLSQGIGEVNQEVKQIYLLNIPSFALAVDGTPT